MRLKDPANIDHENIPSMVMQARTFATAPGYRQNTINPPSVFYFEPHQPEQSAFKADLFLDISDVWHQKRESFEAISSQRGVRVYYERVALQRGAQAGRRSKTPIKYAEAYQRVFPCILKLFE